MNRHHLVVVLLLPRGMGGGGRGEEWAHLLVPEREKESQGGRKKERTKQPSLSLSPSLSRPMQREREEGGDEKGRKEEAFGGGHAGSEENRKGIETVRNSLYK